MAKSYKCNHLHIILTQRIAMIFLFCCKEKKKKKILELLQKLISLHGSIFTNFYSFKKKKKF